MECIQGLYTTFSYLNRLPASASPPITWGHICLVKSHSDSRTFFRLRDASGRLWRANIQLCRYVKYTCSKYKYKEFMPVIKSPKSMSCDVGEYKKTSILNTDSVILLSKDKNQHLTSSETLN